MSFLDMLKKKKAPEELPDLAVEGIKNQITSFNKEKKLASTNEKFNLQKEQINKIEGMLGEREEKSFFDDLLENVSEELDDLNSLENWYKRNFKPKSIIEDMKEHWQKEKAEIVLSKMGKEFKKEVLGKILKMQQLEKEWQDLYFNLMQKEEHMREHEKELKETLSNFIKLCKKKGKVKKGK